MKQVTAILIGAGQRGVQAYASYALQYPNELKFVGVAEPREDRRKEFQNEHEILEENCFSTWEDILNKPRMADCVLICSQDDMHYEPLCQAVKQGYHILCEKPLTADKMELLKINELANNYEKTISVCHVLRYSPFFRKVKSMLEEEVIGEVIHIQHMENIGFWHMAHSFVRGNWRNSEESSPIILAKCCHDFDILLWLSGSSCKSVSSFGSLKHFTEKNAPQNAPKYCMDGCPERETCPYYAPKFYLEHERAKTDGFAKVVSIESDRKSLLNALKSGPYGRCVYRCDNNVCDNQVVNMVCENGITISFSLSAFTNKCQRVIVIGGSKGEIRGNMEENRIEWTDFASGNTTSIHLNTPSGGHSGSDVSMMKSFVEYIRAEGKTDCVTAAKEAVESHLIALAAEESRLAEGMPFLMKKYKEL